MNMKRISGPLTVLVTAFALALSVPTKASGQADGSVIGYWPFDGSGADLSGGQLDLTLRNGAGFAPGLSGQALDLQNGALGTPAAAQDATRPGDDSILNLQSDEFPDGFTIQVWVLFHQTVGLNGQSEQVLIEKFGGSGGPGWTLAQRGGTPSISTGPWAASTRSSETSVWNPGIR